VLHWWVFLLSGLAPVPDYRMRRSNLPRLRIPGTDIPAAGPVPSPPSLVAGPWWPYGWPYYSWYPYGPFGPYPSYPDYPYWRNRSIGYDILTKALREGRILPGIQVQGFPYFQNATQKGRLLTLSWTPLSANEKPLTPFSIQFRIVR